MIQKKLRKNINKTKSILNYLAGITIVIITLFAYAQQLKNNQQT